LIKLSVILYIEQKSTSKLAHVKNSIESHLPNTQLQKQYIVKLNIISTKLGHGDMTDSEKYNLSNETN